MGKKFLVSKCIVFICLLVLVLFTGTGVKAATLEFLPNEIQVQEGNVFTLDVEVAGIQPGIYLGGFNFDILFDEGILAFSEYSLGSDLGTGNDMEDQSEGYMGNGKVNIGEESYLYDFSSQPDSFSLVTLTFVGASLGVGNISIDDDSVALYDSDGNEMVYEPSIYGIANVNVSPVPIPASVYLLATGFSLFFYINSRKRIAWSRSYQGYQGCCRITT